MPRKPTPTSLKILRGNPGKRPLPKGEPQPPTDGIEAPSWLNKVARAKWDEMLPIVQAMRVMTRADVEALARYCDLFAWWLKVRDKLRKEGDSYPILNDAGQVKYHAQRPEVAIAHKLAGQLRSLETDFGLNPSSRTKLDVQPAHDPGNPLPGIMARASALRGQPRDELEEFFHKHG